MRIQTAPQGTIAPPGNASANSLKQNPGDGPNEPKDSVEKGDPKPPHDTGKKFITGAAYALGGTTGGLVLGAIGGKLISNITGNPIFANLGGPVGAVAGTVSGIASYNSGAPASALKRTLLAWTTATVGTGLGMWAIGGLSSVAAANGASAFVGLNGPLIGAMAGGLAGTALAFVDKRSVPAVAMKHAAYAGVCSSLGMLAGAAVQCAANPAYAYTVAAAPALGAVAGALIGTAIYANTYDMESALEEMGKKR